VLRAALSGDPKVLTAFHKWATITWLALTPPIMLFMANSVPVVVGLSVYAIVTGHWAAWQASRVEVKQDEQS
jgi:hypothetical protein